MDEDSNIPRWLSIAAKLVTIAGAAATILLPILYLNGLMFEEGYMGTYGINTEFFPRTVPDYLTYFFAGTIEVATLILKQPSSLFFILSGVVFFIAFFITWIRRAMNRPPTQGPISDWLRARFESRAGTWLVEHFGWPLVWAALVWAIPSIVAILTLLLIPSPFLFAEAGKQRAQEDLKKFEPCKIGQPVAGCSFVFKQGETGGEPLMAGKIVAKSATHIAIYNGETWVYPLTNEVIKTVPRY